MQTYKRAKSQHLSLTLSGWLTLKTAWSAEKTYLHYSLALLNRQLRKYWNVSLLLVRVIICAFSQNDPLGHGKNINGWRDIVYLDSWACCTVMHSIPRKHLFKVFWSESLQNFKFPRRMVINVTTSYLQPPIIVLPVVKGLM